jgi:EAL domain-containing protein (putative c-di-GMP-specific phosphodiesterase class I)/DNA-binding response OmpR family regulator
MRYQNLRVLVVEDDEFQRNIIVEMLMSLGVKQVCQAANGAEALALMGPMQDTPVDIIISDLKMPVMDGIELMRHLAEQHSKVEVIILSAMDKKLLTAVNRISKLHELRLVTTLEKPVSLARLNSAMALCGQAFNENTKEPSRVLHFDIEDILHGIREKQFLPYFQPKVDLKTGVITGAEALARWAHPEHGVIAPYAFIPQLEKAEQIDELTFLMLEESSIVCHKLLQQHHAMNIAVNLSLVSLNNPAIAERITNIVQSKGVSPKYITLEITESTAMTDAPHALENLARLYMSGFTLSIDDYGTGYSNLQQLTRVAFGELKIDQSFVQGVANNDSMLIVVASNIEMAHKLGIKSVAEGVETAQDWEMLRKMDCDIGQGYYIAKPMDASAFNSFVSNYRAQTILSSPESVKAHALTNSKAREKVKILVIDDDEFSRNMVTQLLASLGFQLIEATSSASKAITMLNDQDYDLIITDVLMPEISGLDLIKQVRTGKTHAKSGSKIIILSGLTHAKAVASAMALDVDGILVKPLIPTVAQKKIDAVLAQPLRKGSKIAYEVVDTAIN